MISIMISCTITLSIFLWRRDLGYKLILQENATKKAIDEANLSKDDNDEEFMNFFNKQINVIIERTRLLIIKIENRMNYLFRIGVLLTLISITVPFTTIAIFVISDESVNESINKLNSPETEINPIIVQKDWKIMIPGISYGFLLLAAAGTVFSQYSRQMKTYTSLSKDLDYYSNIYHIIKILKYSEKKDHPESVRLVLGKFIDQIITRPVDASEVKSIDKGPNLISPSDIYKLTNKL